MADARAFLVIRAGVHPRREAWLRENVAAVAPTSAMIWCAESTAQIKYLGQPLRHFVVLSEQAHHFMLKLADLLIHEP
jgi:hypothetical protein